MKLDPGTLRLINLLVTGGVSTAYVLSKSLNLDNVIKNLELKTDGKTQPVPPKIQSLIVEVTEDVKLKTKKDNVKFFMSRSSDVQKFSVPFQPIYIGIPQYYIFDQDDKSQVAVMVDEKEILPTAPEYIPLKEAMYLSKEAKKFGIAQALYESKYSMSVLSFFMPMTIMVNCSFVSYILQSYEKFSKKSIQMLNHYMIFIMGAYTYFVIHDMASIFREAMSDFRASALGQSYAKGGIEYYEKMINRNKIFKKLNKNAPYTEKGDINTSYFRTNHMPLSTRIIYLTELEKGVEISVWPYILGLD